MSKYHFNNSCDDQTNAPSSNFIYDFEIFRYSIRDSWQEVLAHDALGAVASGSVEQLASAFADGCAIKVGVSDLCSDLASDDTVADHEMFVEVGSAYCYTRRQLFVAGSHPVIRVRPAVPVAYHSHGWDSGWLVLRSDGQVVYRRCDPYTLSMSDHTYSCPIRWFVS